MHEHPFPFSTFSFWRFSPQFSGLWALSRFSCASWPWLTTRTSSTWHTEHRVKLWSVFAAKALHLSGLHPLSRSRRYICRRHMKRLSRAFRRFTERENEEVFFFKFIFFFSPSSFFLIILPFCSVWGTVHCKHSLMTVMHQSCFIHAVGLRNLN